ncbi:hypothetical protein D3C85_1177720 [compost metagenome]
MSQIVKAKGCWQTYHKASLFPGPHWSAHRLARKNAREEPAVSKKRGGRLSELAENLLASSINRHVTFLAALGRAQRNVFKGVVDIFPLDGKRLAYAHARRKQKRHKCTHTRVMAVQPDNRFA